MQSQAENKIALSPEGHESRLPDLLYIKSRIPILYVAEKLGITPEHGGATWTRARCFRPENHKNGDRTPSLNFQTKRNKYMCFACDDRLHSNIDLVMAVKGCTLLQAIHWFDKEYPGIPRIKERKKEGFAFRVGVDEFRGPDDLVRAGLVPHLTYSSLRVFTILAAFRDGRDVTEISYQTIKLRSGIASNHTVRRAIRHLEGLSLLEVHRRWSRTRAGGRDTSQYVFSFGDPDLFTLLRDRASGAGAQAPPPRHPQFSTPKPQPAKCVPDT